MGMRFRKSFSLGKGLKLNLSKKSIGISAGIKGARVSLNSSGRKTTSVGIPGTGISFVNSTGGSTQNNNTNNNINFSNNQSFCKWCNQPKTVNTLGLCKDCYVAVKQDVEKQRNILITLAKMNVNNTNKNDIHESALNAYKEIKKYTDKGIPIRKTNAEKLLNDVLKKLGMSTAYSKQNLNVKLLLSICAGLFTMLVMMQACNNDTSKNVTSSSSKSSMSANSQITNTSISNSQKSTSSVVSSESAASSKPVSSSALTVSSSSTISSSSTVSTSSVVSSKPVSSSSSVLSTSSSTAKINTTYVLNTSTKKIHKPSCSAVKKIKPENLAESTDFDKCITDGYEPCGICNANAHK